MLSEKHLIYYWKDIEQDIKSNRIGWLGSSSTKFIEIEQALKDGYDTYCFCFNKQEGKSSLVACLKLAKECLVEYRPSRNYKHTIFYDPRESFRLSRPGTLSKDIDFYNLGDTVSNFLPSQNYQGANGVFIISKPQAQDIIKLAQDFKEYYLSDRYSGPWFIKKINPKINTKSVNEILLTTNQQKFTNTHKSDTTLNTNNFLLSSLEIEEKNISNLKNLDKVETSAIAKIRLGQGYFRSLLISQFGPKCWLSGITQKEFLIASHIKPWSTSSKEEKINPENGLLLSITWDAVFDKGFITFDDSGNVILSKHLDEFTKKQLNLNDSAQLEKKLLTENRKCFLEWHAKNIFENF